MLACEKNSNLPPVRGLISPETFNQNRKVTARYVFFVIHNTSMVIIRIIMKIILDMLTVLLQQDQTLDAKR
jgi:hypothetical protein